MYDESLKKKIGLYEVESIKNANFVQFQKIQKNILKNSKIFC